MDPLRTIALLSAALTGVAASGAPNTVRLGARTYAPLKKVADPQYQCTVRFAPPKQEVAGVTDFAFAARDAKNYGRVVCEGAQIRIERVVGGKANVLASSKVEAPPASPGERTLVLRRGEWWIEAILDGRRVVRTLDSSLRQGVLAAAIGPGLAKVTSARYQRLVPIELSDGFMAAEGETEDLGLWEPVGGEWKLHSVIEQIHENPDARIREGREPDAAHSVNPFCLSCKSSAPALMTAGHDFWHDYAASVAAKTPGGAMGVAFGVTDAKNYWVARWALKSLGVHAGKVELVRVCDAQEEVVKTGAAYGRTDNWYRLEVRTSGSRIEFLIDNTSIITAWDDRSVGGKIGLYAQSQEETYFDDVDVRSWRAIDLDRSQVLADSGQALSGSWEATGEARLVSAPNQKSAADERVYLMGLAEWSAMRYRVLVSPAKNVDALGLVFAHDAKREGRFQWTQGDGGRASLLMRSGSKWRTLTDAPLKLGLGEAYELLVDLTEPNVVKAYVDSELVLRSRAKRLSEGRVGVFARGSGALTFQHLAAFVPPRGDWEQDVDVDLFTEDPYMQGWASPRRAWIPLNGGESAKGARLYQHKGDFYGPFQIKMPMSHGLALCFGADEVESSDAYRVAVHIHDEKDRATVTLTRGGKRLAKRSIREGQREILPGERIVDEKIGPLPVPPDTVSHGTLTVAREGKYVWVRTKRRELFSVREAQPLRGRAVGLAVRESLDLARVHVRRGQVKDYLFERAPADWLKVGTWEVTNRFACDPRWSHMNGRSKTMAALWNKHEFDGDFTLECYAGMRMRQGEMREGVRSSYPRVGDINVSMAQDCRDLFSGYNLIIAAWDRNWSEKWTQFWRSEKVVKRTDRELIPRTRDATPRARVVGLDWDPGGRPVHGAWYYVKVRKTGPRFDFFFDNIPALSYVDPSPLACRRIALWTHQNSIVVARAKIAYSSVSEGGGRLAPKPTATDVPSLTLPRLESTSHPGARFEFEHGLEGWTPVNGDQSAGLSLEPRRDNGGRCLRLTNVYPGGDFGVRVPLPAMDLGRAARLALDCAVPAGVKVDLYLSVKGMEHERLLVQLSGSGRPARDITPLGRFAGFKADGKWHRVSFDLAAALRQVFPGRSTFVLEEARIGYFGEGYLNAGLGGNKQGATYRLDNFEIASIGPDIARVQWDDEFACRVAFTKKPSAELKALKGAQTESGELAPGWWYVNAAAEVDGKWTRLSALPLYVDRPTTVVRTDPARGKAWDGGPIRVTFGGARYAAPDVATASLKAGGKTVSGGSALVSYDPEKRTMAFDVAAAGLTCADGEEVAFGLSYRDNLEQTPALRTYQWAARMDLSSDRTPPSGVSLLGDYVRCDFEDGFDGWQAYGSKPGASLKLDRSRAGSTVLSVLNRECGGYFASRLVKGRLDLGKMPILAFDYRLAEYSRIDLRLRTGLGTHLLKFADNDTYYPSIGEIEGVKRDGQWQHAEVDVRRLLDAAGADFSSRRYVTTDLTFGDWGHRAVPPGISYEIDNFRLIPALSSAQNIGLKWQAHDVAGIKGYSCAWSAKPDDEPAKKLVTDKATAELPDLPEGRQYFHIRAQDRAGNWGPTSHFRFVVDNTPPQIASVSPSDGTGAATSTIQVQLKDGRADLDPAGLRLRLNRRTCSLSSTYTTLDPTRGTFTWDWVSPKRYMQKPIPDGTRMQFELSGIKDFAGNPADPVEWTWHIDYAKDREGPAPPSVRCYSQSLLQHDDFTESTGKWVSYGSGERGSQIETVLDPDTKDHCLRIYKTAQGRRFGAYAVRGNVDCATYRVVSFDYKIPKGVKVNLIVYFNAGWHVIPMTGPETYPPIGRVADARADGKWHHVTLNLYDLLRKRYPEAESYKIRYLAMGSWAAFTNEIGAEFFVDNFCVVSEGLPLPHLYSYALDPTGIQGFSFQLDRAPRSTPDEKPDGTAITAELPALEKPGLWYFHIRACDGAGNWGAAAHYPYFCVDPVPASKEEGLEASDGWLARSATRRTTAYLKQYQTADSGNTLLGLRFSSRTPDKITLRHRVSARAKTRHTLQADFYNGYPCELKAAAYVRLKGSAQVQVSAPKVLPSRTWQSAAKFEIDLSEHTPKAGGTKGKSASRRPTIRERGFIIETPKQKGYAAVLVDNVLAR